MKELLIVSQSDVEYCRVFSGYLDARFPMEKCALMICGFEFRGNVDFTARLNFGEKNESCFAKYLREQGCSTLKFEGENDKIFGGPIVIVNGKKFPAPDRVVLKEGKFYYLEIKTKTMFSNIDGKACVGVDKYYFDLYCEMASELAATENTPYSIIFIVTNDPDPENNGAYVIPLSVMARICKYKENSRYRGGMTYIEKGALNKISKYMPIETIGRSN